MLVHEEKEKNNKKKKHFHALKWKNVSHGKPESGWLSVCWCCPFARTVHNASDFFIESVILSFCVFGIRQKWWVGFLRRKRGELGICGGVEERNFWWWFVELKEGFDYISCYFCWVGVVVRLIFKSYKLDWLKLVN